MAARTRSWCGLLAGLALAGGLASCATSAGNPRQSLPATADTRSSVTTQSLSTTSAPTESTPAAPQPSSPPRVAGPFDSGAAVERIRRLVTLGPRDAASDTYARAAAYVAEELERLGYRVRHQEFRVPTGTSWGVRVPAGTSRNVLAESAGFDPRRPHLVIGAHLDTVPQAPGAEDNASGIAVMLELARMLREEPAALPVRLVAFGGEESRGRGASMYAFGSRHYVAKLAPSERRAVRAMVALDRVGARSATVPVCFGGRGTRAVADALRRAAGSVPTHACRNRASDHVSFEAAGIPAARVGSVPYAAYHSSRDVVSVVERRQLERTGAVLWSWLRSVVP